MNVAERGLAHLPPTTVTTLRGNSRATLPRRRWERREPTASRFGVPRGTTALEIESQDLRTRERNCGKIRARRGKIRDSAAVPVPEQQADGSMIRQAGAARRLLFCDSRMEQGIVRYAVWTAPHRVGTISACG